MEVYRPTHFKKVKTNLIAIMQNLFFLGVENKQINACFKGQDQCTSDNPGTKSQRDVYSNVNS